MKILFLAANPQGTTHLQLDEEVNKIDDGLQRSKLRDQFQLVSKWAVDAETLRRALLQEQPDIVHFSGHGEGKAGLVLVGEDGKPKPATANALAGLFKILQRIKNVQCVLFNACYAEEQAKAVVQHVDYVIGMSQAVRDDAAIAFATGFYDGLGYGLPIEDAFDLGRNAVQFELASFSTTTRKVTLVGLENIAEKAEPLADYLIPVLLKKESGAPDGLTDLTPSPVPAPIPPIPSLPKLDTAEAIQQFRERVREFLSDQALTSTEEFQLATIARRLELSEVKANEILEEENQQREQKLLEEEKRRGEREASIPPKPDELENPGGTVGLDSPFYIERPPVEVECYGTILRPGALIRVKAPRQMGKSSLMHRILQHAKQHDHRTAYLNFQMAGSSDLASVDRFLQWFCVGITDELRLNPEKVDESWKKVFGSQRNCSNYFQRYLLQEIPGALTLGLDEVDQVFEHPEIAKEFFGMLRTWHEQGKTQEEFRRLHLVIVHSKEVYIPMMNINQSPFNVGLPVELPELNRMQVIDLVQRHGLKWSDVEVNQLMGVVDGHPYLLREALYAIAKGHLNLSEFIQIAPTEEGLYGDHLRRHLNNLKKDPTLESAMKQVVASNQPVRLDSDSTFKLRSMGLVEMEKNDVIPLCNLYRVYFRDRLGVA